MEIGIAQVLSEINLPLETSSPRLFSIGWIRSTGSQRGTLKVLNLARLHSKTGKDSSGKKGSPRIKEGKLIFVDDLSDPKTPIPMHIRLETLVLYNGKRIRH